MMALALLRIAFQAGLEINGATPLPPNPPCSLWLFSASSVLNSEKRNTENTKSRREPPRFLDATQALYDTRRRRCGSIGDELPEPTSVQGQHHPQESEEHGPPQ